MPQYTFSISGGHSLDVEDGSALANPTAARMEALRIVATLLREGAKQVVPHKPLVVRVTDESGLMAARVALTVFDASVRKGKHRQLSVGAGA